MSSINTVIGPEFDLVLWRVYPRPRINRFLIKLNIKVVISSLWLNDLVFNISLNGKAFMILRFLTKVAVICYRLQSSSFMCTIF